MYVPPLQTNIVQEDFFNGGLITHPLQALVGKIPNLIVSKQGSNPDENPMSLVRGHTSLITSNTSLYVVDGIPNVPIDQIPIEDIASMELLKGAKAAQYGMRGSSGVVMINTKDQSKQTVSYRTWVGIETIASQPNILSADEFRTLAKQNPNFIDNGSNTDWFRATTRGFL